MKDLEQLSDAQLFALARLVHLREFEFGDPALPLWVIEEPLAASPHELDGPAFDREMDLLEQQGWIEWKKPEAPAEAAEPQAAEGDAGEAEAGAGEAADAPAATPSVHADDEVLATDRAMEHMDALRAELRRRHPDLPEDLPSLVVLSDFVRSPEGMSENAIQRALEEPPSALRPAEGVKTYRRLVKGRWIFMTDRAGVEEPFFPSPFAWAHASEIDERLRAMAGELRSRLAEGNADVLELPADAALRRALREVDRALFVPDSHGHLAYRNLPSPIAFDGEGRSATTTSSPNVCAMVVKSLEVQPGNRVLVCGAKAGFTAALCGHIVGPKGRVICLETNPLVADHARACIKKAGFERRVEVRLVKDVTVGLEGQEPWDAVVVNGKIPKVPRPLVRQMTDGGRLLIFLQSGDSNAQTAYLIRKNGKAFDNKELSTFLFTPIFGEYGYDPPNWQEDLNLIGQELHDVFVSYSTRDQEECDQIVQSFEAAGLRCWMSARNHPVGKDGYEQAIMEALKGARLFLIVLSHQSIASDHVKNELTNATSLRKLMLPLRLSECPNNLPANFQYHLERHQQFDRDKHSMEQVVAAALQLVGVNSESGPANPGGGDTGPAADPEPTAPEPDRARFEALLDAVLADGRITKTEMKMLVKQALAAGIGTDVASATEAVEQLALARNPRAKIVK